MRSDSIAPSVKGTQFWKQSGAAILILGSLPILLALSNSSWLYNSAGQLDSWLYFGYFMYLKPFKAALFPNAYYGSRLPWILPGGWLHQLFDPLTARYILHFAFYYLAVFSLYYVLREATGKRNALLGAVLFGTHGCFLASVGWDYVDGAGITYNLLSLAAMVKAARSSRRGIWLLAGGAATAAMFYTNLFLIVFVPFPLIVYLFLQYQGWTKETFRDLVKSTLCFVAGGIAVTIVLAAVNYTLDGAIWFYRPSVRAFLSLSAKPSPWRLASLAWLGWAYWLALPGVAAIGSTAYLVLRRKALRWGDLRTMFVMQFLAATSIFVVWYAAGGLGLQTHYYVSYLLPSMFPALICSIAVKPDGWKTTHYWIVLLCTVAAFTLSLRMSGSPLYRLLQSVGLAALVLAGASAVVVQIVGQGWKGLSATLCGLWILQVGFSGVSSTPNHDRHAVFERVMKVVTAVKPYTDRGPVLFWFNGKDQAGAEFASINGVFLYMYSQMGTSFPAIDPTVPLKAGRIGVILSSRSGILKEANEALRPYGLKAEELSSKRISHGGLEYGLTICQLAAAQAPSSATDE